MPVQWTLKTNSGISGRTGFTESKMPESNLDDSLTELDWLLNMKASNLGMAVTPKPAVAAQQETSSQQTYQPREVLVSRQGNCTPSLNDKPLYSYATLIKMAINSNDSRKLTLADIYSWVMENFNYYKKCDTSWKNSIRHSLSVNKCFMKIPRAFGEHGKGSFWTINPDCVQDLEVRAPVKRSLSEDSYLSTTTHLAKKIKTEIQEDPDWDGDAETVLGVKAISSSQYKNNVSGEINWDAVLKQDVEISGVKRKTSDLIDSVFTANPKTEKRKTVKNSVKFVDRESGDYSSKYRSTTNDVMFPEPIICGEDSSLSETSNDSCYSSSYSIQSSPGKNSRGRTQFSDMFEGQDIDDFLSKSQKDFLYGGLEEAANCINLSPPDSNSSSEYNPEFITDDHTSYFSEDLGVFCEGLSLQQDSNSWSYSQYLDNSGVYNKRQSLCTPPMSPVPYHKQATSNCHAY